MFATASRLQYNYVCVRHSVQTAVHPASRGKWDRHHNATYCLSYENFTNKNRLIQVSSFYRIETCNMKVWNSAKFNDITVSCEKGQMLEALRDSRRIWCKLPLTIVTAYTEFTERNARLWTPLSARSNLRNGSCERYWSTSRGPPNPATRTKHIPVAPFLMPVLYCSFVRPIKHTCDIHNITMFHYTYMFRHITLHHQGVHIPT
jgi:hypothetical protein